MNMSLVDFWVSAFRSRTAHDRIFTLRVPSANISEVVTCFVEFWDVLSLGGDVGVLPIDATHLRLAALTQAQFERVFDALGSNKLARVLLRLPWDIFHPYYKAAMAACVDRHPCADLAARVTVDSLWLEDTISRRFDGVDLALQSMDATVTKGKGKAAPEGYSTFARIEADNQEREVIASVVAWCEGQCVSSGPLQWEAMEISEQSFSAGEIDGGVTGHVDSRAVICFVEVKHCVRKKYPDACRSLRAVQIIWSALVASGGEALCSQAQRLYDVLQVQSMGSAQRRLIVGGTDITPRVRRQCQLDGVDLFEQAPATPHGYQHACS